MNRIWIVGLIAVLVFLSGCNLGSGKVKVTKKTQYENEVEVKELTFEEYSDEAVRLRLEFYTAIKEFGEVRQDTEMEVIEFRTASLEKIEEIRTIINEFRTIAPPNNYKKIHEEINISLDEFTTAMEMFEESVKERSGEKDLKALEHMEKGQDYWNHAFRLLAIDNPLPIEGGDGTLDTEDLKDLDKNIGIDRDSVLLNVSEDGQELVGKWGFYNEDGISNVSIVLHKNGRYEGYGNGAYPNKDNAIIGTWEWNYLKGTINFHHDYVYRDGQKTEAERQTMPMELQRFNEEGIQLFDLESYRTFSYEKIEEVQ